MASASGNIASAIARLVQGDEDAVREVIHRFNKIGLACLDPQWADALAAQRRERARVRSERQRRWGQTTAKVAA